MQPKSLFALLLILCLGCQSTSPFIASIKDGKVVTRNDKQVSIKGYDDPEATIFFLVRHAEKEDESNDPPLSTEGVARAERLAEIMKGVKLSAATSTNYKRTTETANPTVYDQKPKISVYNPDDMTDHFEDILKNHKGGKVLVVGHSNNIPALLNLFTGKTVYTNIPGDEYSRFYIATVKSMGDASIKEFAY